MAMQRWTELYEAADFVTGMGGRGSLALVGEVKSLFRDADQSATKVQTDRQRAEAVKNIETLTERRKLLTDPTARKTATADEIKTADSTVTMIDTIVSELRRKYNLTDQDLRREIADPSYQFRKEWEQQATALAHVLENFVTHTADAFLREQLGMLAAKLRIQYGITAPTPYMSAAEVRGDAAEVRDQVAAFIATLETYLRERITEPRLREELEALIFRMKVRYDIQATTSLRDVTFRDAFGRPQRNPFSR